MSKPNVLVLGGVGFIGRNLVNYIIKNNLASHVRVIDKVIPETAFLNEEEKASFAKIDYIQGNLCNAVANSEKFFGLEGGKFNYVFNLAAETKYGLSDAVYNDGVFELSRICAQESSKHKVDRFIEVSTAQVYSSGTKPKSESGELDPWTNLAKFKLKAEEELKKIDGLNYSIIRPAIVYGPGDKSGLAPRIVTGAVYKHLDEKMKFLWSSELKINTVHVSDVVKALWVVAEKGAAGSIYNLADKNDTDQEKFCVILQKLYGIRTGYHGKIASQLSKLSLGTIAEEANDKHVQPWLRLCKEAGINYSPLTPYLDAELLSNNSLSVDGSAVESLGFKYEHPQVEEGLVREQLEYFINQNAFPKSILQ